MKKKKSIIVLLLILLSSIIVSNTSDLLIVNDTNDVVEHPQLKSNGFYNLTGSIYIDETDPNYNWSKTVADNEWCSGSGTPSDPYIIEDIYMNQTGIDTPSITIKNSNSYFIIRNCSIYRCVGIYLKNTSHGNLTENYFEWLYHIPYDYSVQDEDILIDECSDINFYDNENNLIWIMFFNSTECTVENNTISGLLHLYESNHISIFDNVLKRLFIRASNNNTIDGNSITVKNPTSVYRAIDLHGYNNLVNNNEITISDVQHGKYHGIIWYSHQNNIITNNRLYGCGFEPYLVDLTEKNTFGTNYVNDRYFYYYVNETSLGSIDFFNAGQIILKNCNDSIIQNQDLTNASTGAILYRCYETTINSNNLSYNHFYGTYISECRNITIINNSIHSCECGITLLSSSFSTIELNNISHSYDTGIYLSGNNNTIKKNFISHNEYGIYSRWVSFNTITENDFYKNSQAMLASYVNGFNFSENIVRNNSKGVFLIGRPDFNGKNYFFNNKFENNTNYGMDIFRTNDTDEIYGNTFQNNIYGMKVRSSHYSIIENNKFLNNQIGIFLSSDNITVRENNFTSNNKYGIFLDFFPTFGITHCEHNIIIDNSFHGCGLGVSDSKIDDMTVKNVIDETNLVNGKPLRFFVNETGIDSDINLNWPGQIILINCTTSNLEAMDVSNSSIGISMSYCEDVRVWKINSTNNKLHGIYLFNCDNISISDSILSYNKGAGIHANEGSNINASDNEINSNNEGIYLFKSSYNLFKSNEIFDNFNTGINIATTDSKNNTIYMNHFDNPNNNNAIDNGVDNEWDNGSIGNEWHDYDGFDCDGDGIGETAYISGKITDNFPICYNLDTFNPIITILSPEDNEVFSEDSPTLSITIEEYILWGFWYTLDGGEHNFTSVGDINEAHVKINEAFWDNLNDGEYLLEVYARDIAGNVGYVNITIEKRLPTQPPDLPILIIVESSIVIVSLIAITIIILKTRTKKK